MPSLANRPTFATQLGVFGLWTLACFGVAIVGAAWTATSLDTWYRALAKPSWNPPDWVFGPVWSTLYLMMAVSAWLVWRTGDPARGSALGLFGLQLALNLGWSGIFFGLREPGLAFAEVLLLWATIAGTIAAFWHHSRWAAALLVPYLAWVSFAAVLNFAVWRLNS